MTFKAYLDSIQAKTGKTPADFVKLAEKKGLLKPGVKTGTIVSWLKEDFGLGHGHAMAIVLVLKQAQGPRPAAEDRIDKQFSGKRLHWRKAYDGLVAKVKKFGPDVRVSPTDSYISILRGRGKFAIVQVTADRFDIGIKLKGVLAQGRFRQAGAWNPMVTHRIQIQIPKEINAEVISWLHRAYNQA